MVKKQNTLAYSLALLQRRYTYLLDVVEEIISVQENISYCLRSYYSQIQRHIQCRRTWRPQWRSSLHRICPAAPYL